MCYLGLDIGGANLKVADGLGYASSCFFPMWQQHDDLKETLRKQIHEAPDANQLVVTMTGELADCFSTKQDGVQYILEAVENAADGRATSVYLCDGRFVDLQTACKAPLLAAASNWHVLAAFAARFLSTTTGLVIDIGSTTTDIIPIVDGKPAVQGMTDPERLQNGELVYTGVERSPLCAVTQELSWRGEACAIAQELFATTSDVYTLLGNLPEDSNDCQTADGRPRTVENAWGRIARALCADVTMFSMQDARKSANIVQDSQLKLLEEAIRKVLKSMKASPETVVLSGHGVFLAQKLLASVGLSEPSVSLEKVLGSEVSRCSCAHALAVLAREQARKS